MSYNSQWTGQQIDEAIGKIRDNATILPGGSVGQFLGKKTATNYDTEWQTLLNLVETESPAYTNQIPLSIDVDGSIYNETGIKSGYILNSAGQEDVNAMTYVTGYIPVKKGDIIRVRDPGEENFDTTLEFVLYQGLVESGTNIGKTVFDIMANTLYGELSIDGNTATWDTSGIGYYFWDNFSYLRVTVFSADAIVTVNQEIANEITTQKKLAPEIKVSKDNLDFDTSSPMLAGESVVVFGDSIIGMTRDNTSVTAYAADYTGAMVYNVGFGGCRMSVHPTNGYAAFSMWALADAITTGDFSTQDAQASAGQDYFQSQLDTLKSIDFDSVNRIVIHYGTNDFGGGVAIDSEDLDNTSTLCGALRYSLDKIIPKYPNAQIYVSVPLFRMFDSESSDVYKNSAGNTLVECVEALCAVAKNYNIPVINGYYGLGINQKNDSYYSTDGTHLSDPGRRLFGNFIGGNLIAASPAPNTNVTADTSPRTYRVVVGTSTAGWTENDCDYLCNGSNDKAVIQSAINTLSYTIGGVLYFLEGTYNFSQLMVSKNNVVFAGDNQKTIFWCTDPEKYLIYTSEDLIFKDIAFHHVEGTKETLSISGGYLQVLHCKFDARSGLDIVSDAGVLLADSEFNHAQVNEYAGHSVGARVYRCSRTENVSADSTPWLLLGGDDVVVDSCYIDSPHTAIQTTGYNVSITNNYITNCQYGIMTSGNVSSYNILNNVIVEYGQYGIYTPGMSNSYMNVSCNYVGMKDTAPTPSGTPMAIAGERNVITSNITPGKEITIMGSRVLIDNNSY